MLTLLNFDRTRKTVLQFRIYQLLSKVSCTKVNQAFSSTYFYLCFLGPILLTLDNYLQNNCYVKTIVTITNTLNKVIRKW